MFLSVDQLGSDRSNFFLKTITQSRFHCRCIWTIFLDALSGAGTLVRDFKNAQTLCRNLIEIGEVTNIHMNLKKS